MLTKILMSSDERYHEKLQSKKCTHCTYGDFCPSNCEKCLDYIHTPSHASSDAPSRKYDCPYMADFYTCKYSCRYASEMIYALRFCQDLKNKRNLKVLSFGCGPCTDLFSLEYLRQKNEWEYEQLEYRGIDYCKSVWMKIHSDIKKNLPPSVTSRFFYEDMCDFIQKIGEGAWVPNLIIFQYVFSDLRKHSTEQRVIHFIESFAEFVNKYIHPESFIVLNDANFGKDYGGGREYFDDLFKLLEGSVCIKGRFRNEHSRSPYYPRGYPYGDDSAGEFPENRLFFNHKQWDFYSPFDSCASAQMIIRKEAIKT